MCTIYDNLFIKYIPISIIFRISLFITNIVQLEVNVLGVNDRGGQMCRGVSVRNPL